MGLHGIYFTLKLNDNKGNFHFAPHILGEEQNINFPAEAVVTVESDFYRKITDRLAGTLKGIQYNSRWFNVLLSELEALTSFIPASSSDSSLSDISFYDHSKITAAIASCIYQYLGNSSFKERLYANKAEFYKEKAFMLFSMDISGIQKFIYTISSKGALKSLRARSFYLEIVMEHIIDELLDELSLTRANLIYSGGGHCYMLLPHTKEVIDRVEDFEHKVNNWFIDNFDVALYIAFGYTPCSAEVLENREPGSFAKLYHEVSLKISHKKVTRYTPDELKNLNKLDGTRDRECRICHRTGKTDSDEVCALCSALMAMSRSIQNDEYFMVVNRKTERKALPLPFDYFLIGAAEAEVKTLVQSSDYRRLYVKNKTISAEFAATHLWVGEYSHDDLDTYADDSEGIKRIGIMRCDVDNLGATFAFGFRQGQEDRYATLSRTAMLSRMLSLFFKHYINRILEKGESSFLSKGGGRKVSIVYSGGDDVFLAGAWNDVIDAFIDLRNSFRKFSQNTLSISGGIGIYPGRFPIHIMAEETEELVERAKSLPDKNGITLFEEYGVFEFERFIHNVMGEKFRVLKEFFKDGLIGEEQSHVFGSSFLYNMLELLRNSEDKINRARLAYLLSRMEPKDKASDAEKEHYRTFRDHLYKWYPSVDDRKELISAVYIYSYIFRNRIKDQK